MCKKLKQADKNLILALILTIVMLLLAGTVSFIYQPAMSELETLKSSMDGKLEQPVEDVAGYALILEGTGYGIGLIGLFLIRLLLVYIPLFLGCYIFSFALIAKLVFKVSDGRILLYRVLMGFSFLGQIIMLLYGFAMITFGGWLSVIGVAGSIGVFLIIFMGIRGTYTQKLIQ